MAKKVTKPTRQAPKSVKSASQTQKSGSQSVKSLKQTSRQPKKKVKWDFPLTGKNFIITSIGVGAILIGYILMATGITPNSTVNIQLDSKKENKNLECNFKGVVTNVKDNLLFVWDFGDGSKKEMSKHDNTQLLNAGRSFTDADYFSHRYAKEGKYDIKLTVLKKSNKDVISEGTAIATIKQKYSILSYNPVGKWNNAWTVTVAPLLLAIGYCVIIPFALLKFYKKKEGAEE